MNTSMASINCPSPFTPLLQNICYSVSFYIVVSFEGIVFFLAPVYILQRHYYHLFEKVH